MPPSRVRIPPSPLRPARWSLIRRGGRAVECGGLENRYGSLGSSGVRISPSPLTTRKPAVDAGLRLLLCIKLVSPAESRNVHYFGADWRTTGARQRSLDRTRRRSQARRARLMSPQTVRVVDRRDKRKAPLTSDKVLSLSGPRELTPSRRALQPGEERHASKRSHTRGGAGGPVWRTNRHVGGRPSSPRGAQSSRAASRPSVFARSR